MANNTDRDYLKKNFNWFIQGGCRETQDAIVLADFFLKNFLTTLLLEIYGRTKNLPELIKNSFLGKTSGVANINGIIDIVINNMLGEASIFKPVKIEGYPQIEFISSAAPTSKEQISDFLFLRANGMPIIKASKYIYWLIASYYFKDSIDLAKANKTIFMIKLLSTLNTKQKDIVKEQLKDLNSIFKMNLDSGVMEQGDEVFNYQIQLGVTDEMINRGWQGLSSMWKFPTFYFSGNRTTGNLSNNGTLEQTSIIQAQKTYYTLLLEPVFNKLCDIFSLPKGFYFDDRVQPDPTVWFQYSPNVEGSTLYTDQEKQDIKNYYLSSILGVGNSNGTGS